MDPDLSQDDQSALCVAKKNDRYIIVPIIYALFFCCTKNYKGHFIGKAKR